MSNMDSSFTGKSNYENNHLMISQGGERKVMKKILSVALSTAMAFSMFASVAFGESGLTDVNAQYNYLKDKGIFSGYPDGQAHLDRNMTRAEFAKVITKTLGLKEITGVYSYNDKNYGPNHWAAPYVEAVSAAGIMEGKNTTKKLFDLSGSVTVQEMATVLVRALDLEIPTETNNTASAWAKGYVQAAINAGLVDANANFQSNATRELLVGAAYAVDQEVSLQVKSYTVSDNGKVVEFTMSDDQTVRVTLDQALEANKETAVRFTYNGKEFTHNVTYVVEAAAVQSVTAVNAATLKVTFTQQLDAKTLFADSTAQENGDLTDNLITFGSVDLGTTAKYFAELSADGKSIIFTAKAKADAFASTTTTKTVVKVADEVIKTANGDLVPAYEELVSTVDTAAPTIASATNKNAATTVVKFSEPVDITSASANLTLPSGSIVSVTLTATDDASEYTIALPSELAAGKTGTVSVVGVQDFAGNLVNPNPSTFNVTKGQPDEIAPTVASVTQSGAKEFTVKFSEELQHTEAQLKSLITVSGTTVSDVEQDSTDKTKYVVTVADVLDGIKTVTFAQGLTDLTGTATDAAITKVVNFVKDTTAPAVSSYAVSQDSTTGDEYLVLTFDKNVDLSTAKATVTTGTYTSNYITTSFTGQDAALNYVDQDNSKKVVRVALKSLLAGHDVENASYSVKLSFTGVTSESGVAVNTSNVRFTRTNDTVASNNAKLEVTDIQAVSGNNSQIKVIFNHAVDGATATTASNYTVQGATVESVVLTDSKTALITLADNSNRNTGLLNVTVANVKNYDKTRVVATTTKAVNLKENVAPTYTAALTGAKEITLTFSENVTGTIDQNDFVVYVAGKQVTVASASATSGKVVVLTLANELTSLSDTITVKAASDSDVVDTVGNAVSTDTVTVSK